MSSRVRVGIFDSYVMYIKSIRPSSALTLLCYGKNKEPNQVHSLFVILFCLSFLSPCLQMNMR